MDERWTAGLPSFAAYGRACRRAPPTVTAAAAFGGLSASLAELLSSSSVLGKDAFTSSMHSAECMKISDRGRNMLVHTVRIYVCKTYVVTLKIA